MSKSLIHFFLFLALAATCFHVSCSYIEEPGNNEEDAPQNYSMVSVSKSDLLMYADLSAYDSSTQETKSSYSDEEESYPLSSLLDFDKVCEYASEDGLDRRIIPFLGNHEPDLLVRAKADSRPNDSAAVDSLMVLRKFLLECGSEACILTMISDIQEYRLRPESMPNNLANYTGYLLYSSLDGGIISLTRCLNGQLFPAGFVPASSDPADAETFLRGVVKQDVSQTKANGEDEENWQGGELDEAYCIGTMTNLCIDESWNEKSEWTKRFMATVSAECPMLIPGGGGIDKSTMHEVKVVSSNLQMGKVKGDGHYFTGTCVDIQAIPIVSPSPIIFHYWTGDLRGYSAQAILTVTHDITSIAYFISVYDDTRRPCVDTTANRANMLVNMSIAPSGGWNYKGGTFKSIRQNDGITYYHWGVDFAAAPGTPVYAPYDGTVIATRTNAPNSKVANSVGNYITVESVIDGKKVQFKFCHLNYGTPIASNPMNGGNPYSAGDKVRAGDLIGFSGKTGNAWKDSEVPCKHVHLETSVNNVLVNPIDYINGKLSADYSTIVNIKCDDLSNSKR